MNWLQKLFTKQPQLIVHSEVNLLIFHMKGIRMQHDLMKVQKMINDAIKEVQNQIIKDPKSLRYILVPSENVVKIEAFNIKPDIIAEVKNEAGDSK